MYNLGIAMYPQPRHLILLGQLGTLERGTGFCKVFPNSENTSLCVRLRNRSVTSGRSLNAAEAENVRPIECDPVAGQRVVVFHTRILPHTFLGVALLAVDSFLTLRGHVHMMSAQ